MKIYCNVWINGTLLKTEVYILFNWILTVCYQKSRCFVFIQNLPVLALQAFVNLNVTDNYKILRYDRKRHGRSVASYINNNFSSNILSVFPCKTENILCLILLPNSKPVIVGTIDRLLKQNNF